MKKHLLLLAVAILANGCIRPPEYNPDRSTASVAYSFTGGENMTDLFNFTATYTDDSNLPVTERVRTLPWTKQIKARLPFDAHLEIRFDAKDRIPDRGGYEVGFGGAIERAAATRASHRLSQDSAGDKLRFSVTLPEGVSPDAVDAVIPALKYDKHFAFTLTVDDAMVNAWSRIFPLIHRKWIDDKEFFHLGCTPTTGFVPSTALAMTDGCGNERRFGFGVALWPTLTDNWHPEGRMLERSTSFYNPYITWEELRRMLDFGVAVHFHNVNETKYAKTDPEQIVQGLADDYERTFLKLGRRMKVLALPDGNRFYIEAIKSFPQIEFARSSLSRNRIYLNDCGSLRGGDTCGGQTTSDISMKLAELAEQAASDNPYWVALTVHRPKKEYMDMLTQICNLYGASGADNIWAASWDEIYEYQELRYSSTVEKSVSGQTVVFEVTVPQRSNFYYHELSFLITGAGKGTAAPVSDNISGFSCADRGGDLLVNVNFDPQLPVRAEKYTFEYEFSRSETDKDDALYFISMLRPELAEPLLDRIEHPSSPLRVNSIAINGGDAVTNIRDITIDIDAYGTPVSYRAGESADLSAVPWQSYTGSPVDYRLSEGYGPKTVYLQLASDTRQSNVASDAIHYSDMPESGVIGRQAAEQYQKVYDEYILTVDKTIEIE